VWGRKKRLFAKRVRPAKARRYFPEKYPAIKCAALFARCVGKARRNLTPKARAHTPNKARRTDRPDWQRSTTIQQQKASKTADQRIYGTGFEIRTPEMFLISRRSKWDLSELARRFNRQRANELAAVPCPVDSNWRNLPHRRAR